MLNAAVPVTSEGSEPRLLKLKVEPISDYLVIKCADCGDMTVNEYLGTTYDRGVMSMRLTCPRCGLSDERKLFWPNWKGLPGTPPLDEGLVGPGGDGPFDGSCLSEEARQELTQELEGQDSPDESECEWPPLTSDMVLPELAFAHLPAPVAK